MTNKNWTLVFSQHLVRTLGTVGTLGTINVHAGSRVPIPFLKLGTLGTFPQTWEPTVKLDFSVFTFKKRDTLPDADGLFPVFPVGYSLMGTEIPFVYTGVPGVPAVPSEKADERTVLAPTAPNDEFVPLVPSYETPPAHGDRTVPSDVEPEAFDALDPLRKPFIQWFDCQIQVDVEAIALRMPPRWCTAVTALYGDHCSWMFDHSHGPVPPTLPEFRHLLLELCFEIRMICGDEYVPNVVLKEDA